MRVLTTETTEEKKHILFTHGNCEYQIKISFIIASYLQSNEKLNRNYSISNRRENNNW